MLLKKYIRQALIICLMLIETVFTIGCSSRSYQLSFCTGGTVVPKLRNVLFYFPCAPWIPGYSKELPLGYGSCYCYYNFPEFPTQVSAEFDDESGKHHCLTASCKLPEDFDGKMILLITRRENLGKTGDIACIDCVELQDHGYGINCQARAVTMQEESEENYDEDYLLKVYLGDEQDFMYDGNEDKFIRSLQREDEYCETNLLFLARDIPKEYEIIRLISIGTGKVPPYFPVITEIGEHPEFQKNEGKSFINNNRTATEELPWYHDITMGPLNRVEMDILDNAIKSTNVAYHFRPSTHITPENRTILSHLDAFNLGLPNNLRGDIAVLLTRDGGSYQLRIFVDNLGSLVAYRDYHSLCQALDKRYERFPKQEVNFHKPLLKGEGMCYLIDCRKQ